MVGLNKQNTYISFVFFRGTNSFDRIAVGLLLFDNDNIYAYYNKYKAKIVNKLLNKNTSNLFKSSVKNIIKKLNTNNKKEILQLSFKNYYDLINNYSIYCNGIIGYDKPSKILIECNKENFEKLIEKYF